MSTGLMANHRCPCIGWDFWSDHFMGSEKRPNKKRLAPRGAAEDQMTPTERWDAHVEQLQKRGS